MAKIILCAPIFLSIFLSASPHQTNISHHTTIVIALVAQQIEEASFLSWSPTFEKYLSDSVGKQYVPSLDFSLILLSPISVRPAIEAGTVHFFFASPSVFACLEVEYSGIRARFLSVFFLPSSFQVALFVIYTSRLFDMIVSSIATMQSKVSGVTTSFLGGVFLVLANNKAVNSVRDFSGKVIEAASMEDLCAGQSQWLEMQSQGLDLMVDPAQVRWQSTRSRATMFATLRHSRLLPA
jgi:hypothetical protein